MSISFETEIGLKALIEDGISVSFPNQDPITGNENFFGGKIILLLRRAEI